MRLFLSNISVFVAKLFLSGVHTNFMMEVCEFDSGSLLAICISKSKKILDYDYRHTCNQLHIQIFSEH